MERLTEVQIESWRAWCRKVINDEKDIEVEALDFVGVFESTRLMNDREFTLTSWSSPKFGKHRLP